MSDILSISQRMDEIRELAGILADAREKETAEKPTGVRKILMGSSEDGKEGRAALSFSERRARAAGSKADTWAFDRRIRKRPRNAAAAMSLWRQRPKAHKERAVAESAGSVGVEKVTRQGELWRSGFGEVWGGGGGVGKVTRQDELWRSGSGEVSGGGGGAGKAARQDTVWRSGLKKFFKGEGFLRVAAKASEHREEIRDFAIMALSARARLGPGVAPACAAYFAAGLERGGSSGAMLLGCMAGAFATGLGERELHAPAECACALALWSLWRWLGARFAKIRSDGMTRGAFVAGAAVLLPSLAAAGYSVEAWITTLLLSLAAVAFAAILLSPAAAFPPGAVWSAWGAAALVAAADLGISPVPLGALCAVALGCSGKGAAAGCFMGAVCAICGCGPGGAVAVAAMGCGADIGERLAPGGAARAIMSAAAYMLARIWLGESVTPLALLGSAAAFLPDHAEDALKALYMPREYRAETVIRAAGRRTQARLRSLSDAFLALSESCGGNDAAFGEQQLLTRMRNALCTGCPDYAACWPGRESRAMKLFCQLMTAAIERGGTPFVNGDVPPEVMRLCRRGMTAPSRLSTLLTDFAVQRHRRMRLTEARRLISAEFSQAAALISAMADAESVPPEQRNASGRLHVALACAGLPVESAAITGGGHTEIEIRLRERWTKDMLAKAATAIAGVMRRSFVTEISEGDLAVFAPRSRLAADIGRSMLPSDPDIASGDSCVMRDLAPGRSFVGISDGMGSGEAAAEQSARVLDLMFAMARADMPRETAVSAVNGVLISRDGEELFATVDVMLLDMNAATAEFTKLAACRSLLVRNGRVTHIEGGRLPLGILEDVRPGSALLKVKRGDAIYMMSDGITDALDEEDIDRLCLSLADDSPTIRAEKLINAAAAAAPRRRDDMCAVCVMIRRERVS